MHQSTKLGRAIRTLYEEIAEFSFDYPLMLVPEAGPKESLHYYLYRFRDTPPHKSIMRLDAEGVPQIWNRVTGWVYRPAGVAMYGLRNLGHYLRDKNEACLDIFLRQVNWLEDHAVIRADGAVVWPHDFDIREGNVVLKAPWVSANVQGFVISALLRGWRITRRPHLLELLRGCTRVFQLGCECDGIRVQAEGHVVYTEVPGLAAPGIMDGFMRSLLGLYDLYVEMGESDVDELFQQGVDGLKYFLPRWDYRKKWSVYSNRHYLCSPAYHWLNRLLLCVLARLTGEACFAEYAEAWNPDRLSTSDRAEIYLAFLLTKNACRLKYCTWQQGRSLPIQFGAGPLLFEAEQSEPSPHRKISA